MKRGRQRGISLLEALIAVSIIAIVGSSIYIGLSMSIKGTDSVTKSRAAIDVAQSQMEAIKLQSFDTNPTPSYLTLDPGDLPGGFTQSDISIDVTRIDETPADGTEDIHRIVVEVEYDGGNKSVTLEGYKSNR